MTECERLIRDGSLDPAFLETEVLCEYRVDSKMKKLWALQIDLIKQVEKICKNYRLTYYLIGGGCIGAIRHKGCIPWDDDLDIAMKRDDYNKFMEIAPSELQFPYFCQTPVTDPSFYRPHIVVRNSNGTCISKGNQKLSCNNGVCIDVFPLDGYADNTECRLFRRIGYYRNLVAVISYNASSAGDHKILRRLLSFSRVFVFPLGIRHFFVHYNKRCTKLSEKYKGKIGIQYTHWDKLKWTWNASVFDGTELRKFEYTEMPVPVGYHEMMTVTYGDYMKFPPVEKRGDKHVFEIEPDVPYKEYCGKKFGVKY